MFSAVYFQRMLEEEVGIKKAMSLLYWQGKFQAQQGITLSLKKHGLKKRDIVQTLQLVMQQCELTGLGKFWLQSHQVGIFTFRGKSIFAKEYKFFFGKQLKPIDYHMRGQVSGTLTALSGEEYFCYQTSCISMAHDLCEYVAIPSSQLASLLPKWRAQQVHELSIKKMKIKEPYAAYDESGL
jgi:hypothetical protein